MQPVPEIDDISYRNEAWRKATHFIALLIPLTYILFPRYTAAAIMGTAFLIVTTFEVFRLRRMAPWRVLEPALGIMVRPKEQKGNFTGAFYILLAGTLTVLLFGSDSGPSYLAATAISFEIAGDVASAMVGRKFGRHKIRGSKSVEGALGFLLVALLIIVLVPRVPYTVGIVGAIVAALVEAISIYRDDNLTVPLSSGLVMYLMVRIWPTLP